ASRCRSATCTTPGATSSVPVSFWTTAGEPAAGCNPCAGGGYGRQGFAGQQPAGPAGQGTGSRPGPRPGAGDGYRALVPSPSGAGRSIAAEAPACCRP